MERWTFLILSAADGSASQIRLFLRAGEDAAAWPVLQVAVDGSEVPVDEVAKDYEAPEWKALELFREGGGTEERWEALKDRLRAEATDPA
jgi:hypothetical protein